MKQRTIEIIRQKEEVEVQKRLVEEEKEKTEKLLLNVLPKETAEELKNRGRAKARSYRRATVMFTDFKGFTEHSQNLTPEALVRNVDYYFSRFDAIVEKYDLEKIKTIGDAYMCAGGLPFASPDHSVRVVKAALEIVQVMEEAKNEPDILDFEVRVGINSGPVVAGVVGTKKFAYDIWGDTVNVASRMESMSLPGKINVSENTFDHIKHEFQCEQRGEVFVKNKGKMKMFFVIGKKENEIPEESMQKKVEL